MSESMVERVARAIRESQANMRQLPARAKGDLDSPWVVGPSILLARAAIASMREPTEGMMKVAWSLGDGNHATPDEAWPAMIDEALR